MKYFIFFLLLLFVACTHKEVQSTLKKMDTPVSSMMSPINLSEIASSVKCIPLAMQDSIVMDELTQVIVKDSFIYAADRASLYKFSLTGELMSVVNHRGSSPTEYINISDFQVDENGNVWVLSRNNKALFNYSWDGNLHKKISLDTWFERFSIINGEKMLLYAGNEKSNEYRHTLYILDLQKEKIVNRYLEIDDNKSVYLHVKSPNHFSYSGDSRFFYQMFNDTIYTLNKGGVPTPEYLLSFADKNIPSSFYEQKYGNIMDFFQNLLGKGYAYGTDLFLKNDTFSLYSFYYDRHAYWYVTKEKTSKLGNILKDDVCLLGYEIQLEEAFCFVQTDGQIVIPLLPYSIMEYANDKLDTQQKDKLLAMLRYIGEEQNPVLMIIKM